MLVKGIKETKERASDRLRSAGRWTWVGLTETTRSERLQWENPRATLGWAPKTQDRILGSQCGPDLKQRQSLARLPSPEALVGDKIVDAKATADAAGKTQDSTEEPQYPEENTKDGNMAWNTRMGVHIARIRPRQPRGDGKLIYNNMEEIGGFIGENFNMGKYIKRYIDNGGISVLMVE